MLNFSTIEEVNPLFIFSGGSWDDITVECKACHSTWKGNGSTYETVTSCPNCGNKRGSSFSECFIMLSFMHFLPNETVIYHRDCITVGMELDIYIPSLHLALEPGSWIYHKPKIGKDARKRQKCAEKNIRLVTIYDSYDDDEPPFPDNCYVFPFDIAQEPFLKTLIDLTTTLLSECDITVPDNFEWKNIIAATQSYDVTWDTETYQQALDRRAPGIRVLENYVNQKTPIKHQCDVCHQSWVAKPANVLMSGCQCCSRQRRSERMTMTHEEFAEKTAVQHPTLEILGQYENALTKIEMRCKECGTTWMPTPASLQRGVGCPKCAAVKRGRERARSQEEFLEELKQVNPDVEVLGTYTDIDGKIKARCTKHDLIWEPTAYALLTGRRCPECAKEQIRQKSTKPLEQFLTELTEVWPDYEYIDGYVNTNTRVHMRCGICGHEWNATPHNLLCGHGCPECAKQAGALKKREQNLKNFLEKLERNYPGTTLVSEYNGSTTPVTVRCPYGHERTVKAVSLTSGRAGCKTCRRLMD